VRRRRIGTAVQATIVSSNLPGATVPAIWDRYLDVDDAADLLHALAVLERHRAVREPLPLNDLSLLLERLHVVANIARDEVAHWSFEANERHLEASVDGGRWGSSATARTMAVIAEELAASSQQIAEAADAAARDLAPRIAAGDDATAALAQAATALDVQRLLERARDW